MYDFVTTDLSDETFAELSAGLNSESDISSSESSSRQELTPFDWDNIKPTFTILWKGLLAIFVVIGIIIAVVWAINFCIAKAEKARKNRVSTPVKNIFRAFILKSEIFLRVTLPIKTQVFLSPKRHGYRALNRLFQFLSRSALFVVLDSSPFTPFFRFFKNNSLGYFGYLSLFGDYSSLPPSSL